MLNNLEYLIRYIRCIVKGDVTEKVSVQRSGYLPDSETLSHIISVERKKQEEQGQIKTGSSPHSLEGGDSLEGGEFIYIGGEGDNKIRKYDSESLVLLKTSESYGGIIRCMAFNNKREVEEEEPEETTDVLCYFDGWDYTLEQDKTGLERGKYYITFKEDETDYEIKYAVGDKKVYPDFPRADVSFPRVSVIQNSISFNAGGHGNWNSLGKFKAIKKVTINIYVMNNKDGCFTLNNVKHYGLSGVDVITEEIISNLMSIGSVPNSIVVGNCSRKTDRPFIYPFINFNIRSISAVEYDAQYGIWSRTLTVEGDIIE